MFKNMLIVIYVSLCAVIVAIGVGVGYLCGVSSWLIIAFVLACSGLLGKYVEAAQSVENNQSN